MKKLLIWLLAALPYIGFVFGVALWLELGMWYLDIGLASPLDEAIRFWGSIVYIVCAFITLAFVNDLAYHDIGYKAYRKNSGKLWLALAVQALFWFLYLPSFASRCSERKTTFSRVALVVGERWLLMWAQLLPKQRLPAVNDEIEYEDGEPDKDRTRN